jgi:NAD(P)-dependent dehydrogenase (short-subunit alcohol dehydrogenase family)
VVARRWREALTGLLEGKAAVVSGAARGQGRAHAVRLAREGADIIAMDICADIDTVHYPLATPEDLHETVVQIERLGRRIAATETDVRDATAVAAAIDSGVADLGRLDILVANAGVAMYDAADTMSEQSWRDSSKIISTVHGRPSPTISATAGLQMTR